MANVRWHETYDTLAGADKRVRELGAAGIKAHIDRHPSFVGKRDKWDVIYSVPARRNPRALPGTVSLDSRPRGGKEPFYAENLYHCTKCHARHLRYSGIGRAHFSLRQRGK